jgi:cytochrome c biogenesis protein CcmG/thiol:disulfide interchange protein DsbE
VKRLFLVVAVVAVLAALFIYGLQRGAPDRVITSNLTGKSVPAFDLPLHTPFLSTFGSDLDYRPGSYGKPVIINFWATWCAPCRTEAPLLQAAWQEFGDEVEIIRVPTLDKDRHQAGRDFIAEFGLTFPNVMDNSNRVGISYGIFGLPETFFVAADGTLLHKHSGAVTREVLDEQIRALTR